MFLTVNTELLTMLMTSLARDADALGSIKVEIEIHFFLSFVRTPKFSSPRAGIEPGTSSTRGKCLTTELPRFHTSPIFLSV